MRELCVPSVVLIGQTDIDYFYTPVAIVLHGPASSVIEKKNLLAISITKSEREPSSGVKSIQALTDCKHESLSRFKVLPLGTFV